LVYSVPEFLKGKGLLNYVSGKESCHEETDAKFADWDINNNKILTWIANTIILFVTLRV